MTINVRFFDTGSYTAADIRSILKLITALEGVLRMSELKVSQRAAGANKTIDISPGNGLINGDFGSVGNPQYTYHFESTAVSNLTVADNTTLTQRNDIVIARVYDTAFDASGLTVGTIEIVQGTTNATDPAIPLSSIALARLKLPLNFTSISSSGTISGTVGAMDDMRQRWLPADYMSTGWLAGATGTTASGGATTTPVVVHTFQARLLPNRRYRFCHDGYVSSTVANDLVTIQIVRGSTIYLDTSVVCDVANVSIHIGGMRPVVNTTDTGLVTFNVQIFRARGSGTVKTLPGGFGNIESWVEDMGDIG